MLASHIQIFLPLFGGMMIGLAASILLLFQGRVMGISGILAGVVLPKKDDTAWRVAIIAGLAAAGMILRYTIPLSLEIDLHHGVSRYVVAGLLVGFGTQLGSGCTSGHGICGLSRLSARSLVATLTFIASGIVTVALVRALGGTP